jgi:hypothetical protein
MSVEIILGVAFALLIVAAASLFFLYSAVVSHRDTRQEQRLEFLILKDLLDKSFETMKYFGEELSTLDRALLEMRMQRIKFYLKT